LAYAGASSQVDNGDWAATMGSTCCLKGRAQSRPVADVELVELKAGMVEDLLEAPLLEPDVIGVVEVVDPDYEVAGMEEQLGDLAADEARTACQYNGPQFHGSLLGALYPNQDEVLGAAFDAIAQSERSI
jgi:hypothetical protein